MRAPPCLSFDTFLEFPPSLGVSITRYFSVTFQGAIRNLVSRDVVVVTIQYRLGMLGRSKSSHARSCLSMCRLLHDVLVRLSRESRPLRSGFLFRMGSEYISQQIAALQWVQRYIRYFGGDPDRFESLSVNTDDEACQSDDWWGERWRHIHFCSNIHRPCQR